MRTIPRVHSSGLITPILRDVIIVTAVPERGLSGRKDVADRGAITLPVACRHVELNGGYM